MDDLVEQGVQAGRFATSFPHEASRAVVTMCTGVARWYRPDGELSPHDLAERYIALARATVEAR